MIGVIIVGLVALGSFIVHRDTLSPDTQNNVTKAQVFIDISNASDLICSTLSEKAETGSDLPNITHLPFVGREKTIQAIVNTMSTAHLISVTGAPGFGKSSLAIHVGYRVRMQAVPVRYLDVIDAAFTVYRAKNRVKSMVSSETSVQSKSDLPMLASIHDRIRERGDHFKELLEWSKSLDSRTLLILDNCDDQLGDTKKYGFVTFLQELVTSSNRYLHVILTSELRILITDDFESLKVNEP